MGQTSNKKAGFLVYTPEMRLLTSLAGRVKGRTRATPRLDSFHLSSMIFEVSLSQKVARLSSGCCQKPQHLPALLCNFKKNSSGPPVGKCCLGSALGTDKVFSGVPFCLTSLRLPPKRLGMRNSDTQERSRSHLDKN